MTSQHVVPSLPVAQRMSVSWISKISSCLSMHRRSEIRFTGVFSILGHMTVEIITTVFIAKPADLDHAYALYAQRIAQAPAQIFAPSAAPLPQDNDFVFWSLLTHAGYDRFDSHTDWN